MGAKNALRVFEDWTHLKHRPARLLAFLAVRTLDADAPPVYFGGWRPAAAALGLDTSRERVAQEQLRRVVNELEDAGAVLRGRTARPGLNGEYALALDPAATFKAVATTTDDAGRPVTVWEPRPRLPQGGARAPLSEGAMPLRQRGECPSQKEGQKKNTRTTRKGRNNIPSLNHSPAREQRALPSALPLPSERFDVARAALDALPDRGRAALAAVDASHGHLPELDRVIIAADLAHTEGAA